MAIFHHYAKKTKITPKRGPISWPSFYFIPSRWLTVIVGEEFPIDLRMLKSFRCLRPLKMVSKVPSKLPVELSLFDRDFALRTDRAAELTADFCPREKREFRRKVVNLRQKEVSDKHYRTGRNPQRWTIGGKEDPKFFLGSMDMKKTS